MVRAISGYFDMQIFFCLRQKHKMKQAIQLKHWNISIRLEPEPGEPIISFFRISPLWIKMNYAKKYMQRGDQSWRWNSNGGEISRDGDGLWEGCRTKLNNVHL